jgi:hypothetical protein
MAFHQRFKSVGAFNWNCSFTDCKCGEHDPNIGNEQRDVTIHIDFEEIRAQLMHFHTALKQLSKGFPWKNGNELQTSLYVRLHK